MKRNYNFNDHADAVARSASISLPSSPLKEEKEADSTSQTLLSGIKLAAAPHGIWKSTFIFLNTIIKSFEKKKWRNLKQMIGQSYQMI